ncbi:MAG: DUF488 family protein [Candidatus Hodarchaeota archaeon]
MRTINKEAQKIMDKLTEGLGPGNRHRRIDNGGSGIMAVVVEDIGRYEIGPIIGTMYSVAHYYTQNGDPMRDPEMVFWKAPHGRYYPMMFQQDNGGLYQESIFKENGRVMVHPRMQKDQAVFAGIWMKNIKHQHNKGGRMLYSIGYQHLKDVESLIQILQKRGIHILVDVRSRPYSRKVAFNKNNLKAKLADAGITYEWSGDRLGGCSPIEESAIKNLAEWQKGRVVCLMCMERGYTRCHRYYAIARRLKKYNVEVVHL